MYVLIDGTEVTKDDITAAFATGRAVLIHGRGEGRTTTGLMLDGVQRDTRGECYSAWEETWTRSPSSLREALNAARVRV